MRRKIMRTLGLILTCGIAAVGLSACGKKSSSKVQTPEKEGYNILWADEFNDSKLDEKIWMREVRPAGWTNNELQRYVKDEKNGYVKNGKFVIKGIEDSDGYTSCKLRNTADAAFMYGRIEVSAKVPKGQGLWPAIWMMPLDENKYGQWPKCGEIDIMEVLGHETEKAYGTLHWGEPHAEKQGTVTLDGTTFADDFHEYAIEWEPGQIEWFIDGKSYLVVNDWFTAVEDKEEKPYPAPFNQDFCIQINLAIGGDWPGNPERGASYMKNAEFEIDYVRVYQKPEYDTNVTKPEKDFRKPDATGNYISDTNFENAFIQSDEEVGWKFYKTDGGKATTEKLDDGGIKVNVTSSGSKDYSVQLFHTFMPFEKGKTYKISFDYKADIAMKIHEVCIDAPNANWSRYWATDLNLDTEWKTFTDYFTMTKKDDNAARFEFNMGSTVKTSSLYFRNVRVEEVETYSVTVNAPADVSVSVVTMVKGVLTPIDTTKKYVEGTEIIVQILNSKDTAVTATLAIEGSDDQTTTIDAIDGDEPGAGGFTGIELTGNMTLTIA